MSLSLSRREIMLTQLCTLRYSHTDLVSQANRYLPRILRVLHLGGTDPTEIANLILELQISRTDIALKTYIIYLSERSVPFRFLPVRGFWTERTRGEPHLILHLRGNFQDGDTEAMTEHPDLKPILEGPFTYILTPEVVTPDYITEAGVDRFFYDMFAPKDQDRFFQFLLENESQG